MPSDALRLSSYQTACGKPYTGSVAVVVVPHRTPGVTTRFKPHLGQQIPDCHLKRQMSDNI